MKKEELKELFKKYSAGTCTDQEKALLESWYLAHNEPGFKISNSKIEAAKSLLFLKLPGNETIFPKIGLRLVAAAVLIGFLISVTVVLLNSGKLKPTNKLAADVPPGTNKATLAIGTGQRINLTDALNGTLATKGGVTISKNKSGQITFSFTSAEHADHTQNTLSTPAGGQWQVKLSDGTQVWLNSASKLTFPASFAKLENRFVTLEGEGYFEVAKDTLHPFIVISGNQRVEVLGTHFNINSYSDEPTIKTTLLQGRVKVSLLGTGSPAVLKPGDQASVSATGIEVQTVDTNEAVAWKDGYFQFENEPVNSVMRKLARWYNIEIKYVGTIPTEGLTGRISRNNNISQVFNALEATKTVHLQVEGRRVIIMR
jgi:transmembrane sensor